LGTRKWIARMSRRGVLQVGMESCREGEGEREKEGWVRERTRVEEVRRRKIQMLAPWTAVSWRRRTRSIRM